jgi:hypothetical protein
MPRRAKDGPQRPLASLRKVGSDGYAWPGNVRVLADWLLPRMHHSAPGYQLEHSRLEPWSFDRSSKE